MATKDSTDSRYTVSLDRSDVTHTDDGDFLIPVLLGDEDRQTPALLKIGPDDGARLHAQLDRLLSRGWAMSERDKAARRNGDYPISGSSHLK